MAKRARLASGFLAYLAALAGGTVAPACSSEDERPPPYVHPAVDDPKRCIDLRTNGVLAGSEIRIDGKRANCAAEGIECTLKGSSEFVGLCDAGQSAAICRNNVWRFVCSGAEDAGTDGGP